MAAACIRIEQECIFGRKPTARFGIEIQALTI